MHDQTLKNTQKFNQTLKNTISWHAMGLNSQRNGDGKKYFSYIFRNEWGNKAYITLRTELEKKCAFKKAGKK